MLQRRDSAKDKTEFKSNISPSRRVFGSTPPSSVSTLTRYVTTTTRCSLARRCVMACHGSVARRINIGFERLTPTSYCDGTLCWRLRKALLTQATMGHMLGQGFFLSYYPYFLPFFLHFSLPLFIPASVVFSHICPMFPLDNYSLFPPRPAQLHVLQIGV